MKVQIAFDRPLNDNAINFVKVGRTIWPIRALQIAAPIRFNGVYRGDKYGIRPLSLRKELFRGVDVSSGELYTRDHRGKQVVFSYFNPSDRPADMPPNYWPVPPRNGEGGNASAPDDGTMDIMSHQYVSLLNESLLICTEEPGEQQIIIRPECQAKAQPVENLDDYIGRFGDG